MCGAVMSWKEEGGGRKGWREGWRARIGERQKDPETRGERHGDREIERQRKKQRWGTRQEDTGIDRQGTETTKKTGEEKRLREQEKVREAEEEVKLRRRKLGGGLEGDTARSEGISKSWPPSYPSVLSCLLLPSPHLAKRS